MNLSEKIAEKNEMLKKSAEYIESLSKNLEEAKGKIAELVDALDKTTSKMGEVKTASDIVLKRIEAEKLATTMIEKGILDPIVRDETVESFVNSPDSIEKIGSLVGKLSGDNKIGEIFNEKIASDDAGSSAERKFNARSDAEKINQ